MGVKIVLQQNVDNLGKAGEIVTVKEGYARNFLLVFGYAKLATEEAVKEAEKIIEQRTKNEKEEMEKAKQKVKEIEKIKLTIIKKSKGEKLFGSVSSTDIETALKEKEFEFDKKQINILDPIRTLGEHEVEIELSPEVKAIIKVEVEAEEKKEKEDK